jgi:hypothetical protein
MSKEFPLFPELSKEGSDEAQKLIESFKAKITSAAEDAISNLYCDILHDIESDSWSNYRNDMMAGFKDYKNKSHARYDFKAIRAQILKDHREEIIKDLNQDMVEEIASLKSTIETIQRLRH